MQISDLEPETEASINKVLNLLQRVVCIHSLTGLCCTSVLCLTLVVSFCRWTSVSYCYSLLAECRERRGDEKLNLRIANCDRMLAKTTTSCTEALNKLSTGLHMAYK